MNRKYFCIIISFLISFIFIFLSKNKRMKSQDLDGESSKILTLNDVQYDEESDIYYLEDEETGEIIGASKYKEDLQFYIDNPDYNPNPLNQRSSSIENYILESSENNEID